MHALASSAPFRLVTASAIETEFEERLPELGALAFRVAFGVLRQRGDAEDVAQEALVRAHRRLAALREASRLRPWLVRLTWRLALDHRRAALRRERRETAFLAQANAPDVEQLAAGNEFRERLWRAIDELPEDQRVVIVLAGIEGHGMRELAELLGLPEGTVKSRLHHARRRLAEALR